MSGTDGRTIEPRIHALGRDLFARIERRQNPLRRSWWDDRFTRLVLGDPALKVQLFRFIDALPMLRTPDEVARHLHEYLEEAGEGGSLIRRALLDLTGRPLLDRPIAFAARRAARGMASRFIAGSTPDEAADEALRLRRRGIGFTLDLLGEAVLTDVEADRYRDTCLGLLRSLAPRLAEVAESPRLDRDDRGLIPRVNLSVKLSSLLPHFDPMPAEATTERVLERLRPILSEARKLGAFVNVDMEQHSVKDLTYAIFRRVLMEPEFRDWADVGVVCQAYLREAPVDLERLRDFARERGTSFQIRLVKGAYWDYEVLHAGERVWPVPVLLEKWRTDAAYEQCTRFLLENREWLRPAFGSHNVRSIAHALARAESMRIPTDALEFQALYGMGEGLAEALAERGLRTRVYCPFGELLPGMAYLVRRLLENTANESFLHAASSGSTPVEQLLANPEEVGAMRASRRQSAPRPAMPESESVAPFQNEPLTDFSLESARKAMAAALVEVRARLGGHHPILIGGEAVNHADRVLKSVDPSDLRRVVGTTPAATPEDADRAVRCARQAASMWAVRPAAERAYILRRAAEIMRRRRFELAAWEVYECAKPWREADGDVAEAIDFCEFYAREMLRLSRPRRRDVPGETNRLEYMARGVAVVIPPWNFPLAIPAGMTVAALVAGNTVVLKPAEQSPVMASLLVEILHEAGVPGEVLHYLPGVGEEVGPTLVEHPEVDLVAFTGSRRVGLLINEQASRTPKGQDHVKRVIAEMGGKNAILVDSDADLDEAVGGVLQSAFGYAGQKCSACSRVIVHEAVYDGFLTRLAEALPGLSIGPADDPDTAIPPVIDTEARDRIRKAQAQAAKDGRVVAQVDPGALAEVGCYVPSLIVADLDPDSTTAQEEIFGPVLGVLRASDMDQAIALANGTQYALTAGIYSRSPRHIERASRELRVGNIYINRPITGALVDRQPFGGFKLSGIGTKAGGPDYLKEFLLARAVTENTMRRGFAPELGVAEGAGAEIAAHL